MRLRGDLHIHVLLRHQDRCSLVGEIHDDCASAARTARLRFGAHPVLGEVELGGSRSSRLLQVHDLRGEFRLRQREGTRQHQDNKARSTGDQSRHVVSFIFAKPADTRSARLAARAQEE